MMAGPPNYRPHVSEPFRQTMDDHPALARDMETELQKLRAAEVEAFISAKDWPDFQKRRGVVEGLDHAIRLCQDARKRLNG